MPSWRISWKRSVPENSPLPDLPGDDDVGNVEGSLLRTPHCARFRESEPDPAEPVRGGRTLVEDLRPRYPRAVRRLVFSINVTLDGSCDHRAGIPDPDTHRHAAETIARADALLFGRVTYQMMEEAWRTPSPDMPAWTRPFATSIGAAKKYVVSSTLERVDLNAELVRGDLREAVMALKREPGDSLFVGGTKLAQALTELDLIDEYEVLVHPRFAGHGPTLFAGLTKYVDLSLVSHQKIGAGAVALRYLRKRDGAPKSYDEQP